MSETTTTEEMTMETTTNGNGHAATNKQTAIEIAKPTMARAYEPQSYSEALAMAKTLAGSSLLGALKTAEAVFLVMATGAELGIPPTAALRAVHIVQGRPVLSADLIVGICLRSSICEYFTPVDSTSTQATYETKRRGSGPVRNTFTLDDAKAAGLASKDNWRNYTRAMLRHRAAAELARMVYPDLVLGIYAEEEFLGVGDNAPAPASPTSTPPQEILDGEVVKGPPHDDSLTRITAAYGNAKTLDEVKTLRSEAAKLGLDKDGDDYKGLRALDREAVERIKSASEA